MEIRMICFFFFFAFQNDILKVSQWGRDKGISWCNFSGKQVRRKFPKDFPGGPVVKNLPANKGTWVRSLAWEGSICREATEPTHHDYWAWTLEPGSCSYGAHSMQLLKWACSRAFALQQEKILQREALAPQLEKAFTATKTQHSQKFNN